LLVAFGSIVTACTVTSTDCASGEVENPTGVEI
jgi:hypothetical protein